MFPVSCLVICVCVCDGSFQVVSTEHCWALILVHVLWSHRTNATAIFYFVIIVVLISPIRLCAHFKLRLGSVPTFAPSAPAHQVSDGVAQPHADRRLRLSFSVRCLFFFFFFTLMRLFCLLLPPSPDSLALKTSSKCLRYVLLPHWHSRPFQSSGLKRVLFTDSSFPFGGVSGMFFEVKPASIYGRLFLQIIEILFFFFSFVLYAQHS